MAKVKIKKGDKVQVLAGSYRGKQGQVLVIYPEKNRAIVEGVNIVKKHRKPSAENPQGSIIEKEASIHISNLALLDPKSGKPTRVSYKMDGEKKVRVATKSGEVI
ncbi:MULTISPECIES: 50S ribosomal protein L24 [Apibacter]|uniref:50S ribosomal protein L24 n=1 Tax=Apibacter TaxID=1778601 RepID=UPI000CF9D86E|nr:MULTISPECIES: 50S ribosomal protein L24 [Apibacter]MCX8676983.1 50S ribosomal protein L24 [Apibacter sp. B3919]MXO24636.1 50S ribosomal protein L24 [Apibacter sp. B3924]MXO25880.1 50S ribosomal protein L24 [Apibacter sp. B3813]MXO27831.1 50S ribosomal protein L24 [Apibacter sp. B3913]MXO29809.1 50S ribosomal protein L24 [Apibacter sp. B3912]